MNKLPYQQLSRYRMGLNLKLKDIAYLLDIDQGNLSRFEAGKSQYPKALIGYHLLFDLSSGLSTPLFIKSAHTKIVSRCFELIDILENKSKTPKNRLRIKGLNTLIKKLTGNQQSHDQD